MPGTDLLGGLDHIEEKAASDQYQNEYDFELDIYNLAGSTNDGHFAYQPWLTNNFFTGSKNNLVSVSLDGVEEPKVYFLCKCTCVSIVLPHNPLTSAFY